MPGTNPFFPMPHDLQGNRFLELLAQHPLEVYVLNTGRVGGPDGDERSRKVRIKHSSAIVKGIAEGTIEWEQRPGLRLPRRRLGAGDRRARDPAAAPALRASRAARDEYRALVERFKAERAEFLRGFSSL